MSDSDAASCLRFVPQQLTDAIIDDLPADEATLKFCSLANRAWVGIFLYPGASVVADPVCRLHADQPTVLEGMSKFSLEQLRVTWCTSPWDA